MTSVLHVIDGSCDETQLQVLAALAGRLDGRGWRHRVCSIDGPMVRRAGAHLPFDVMHAERRGLRVLAWSPRLPSIVRRSGATVLHAWGVEAAVASARFYDVPLITTLLNPESTPTLARWMLSFPTTATVVVGSQAARTLLVGTGLAPDRVVVIRGPADYGAINTARRRGLRAKWVGSSAPVVLMTGPASRDGGQFTGTWASAIVAHVHHGLRVLLPYPSRENQRIQRLVRSLNMPSLLVVPDAKLTWPELAVCADVLLVPATGEICTEPISVAMAAGLVVVGTAVRSVTEVIADRHNGLLCKTDDPPVLASRLLTAIEDSELTRKLTETARGHAYEVFSVRTFADNYRRLYENVLEGRLPGDNVRDPAMVA